MTNGHASINGLNMYYEIEGSGPAIVYIPPALAHVGLRSFPELSQGNSVIKIDLQGYGRTADIPDRPMSIEQHAQDVFALIKHLKISKADFFGESYGGAISAMIALRHPEIVRRVATYGATFGPPQVAIDPGMMQTETPLTASSESFGFQREGYGKVAPNPGYWSQFWEKTVSMKWEGFSKEDLASIKAPFLIALGDHDFVRLEHAVESFRIIPNSEVAVINDAGHFLMYSEPSRMESVLKYFFGKPEKRESIATAGKGYRPSETR